MAYKFPDSVQIPMAQTLHIMQALITIAIENAAPRLHNFIGQLSIAFFNKRYKMGSQVIGI